MSPTGNLCIQKICAQFGPTKSELAENAAMSGQFNQSVVHWKEAGAVLQPDTVYHLEVVTTAKVPGKPALKQFVAKTIPISEKRADQRNTLSYSRRRH